MSKQMTGLTIDEIWDLLQGPLSFALYDVPSSDQHKLDLVLSLGAPDGAKLEKAAFALKENLKQQGGNLTEGEYARAGATIREFGNNELRLYYTLIQKTLIIATRQERMDQIVDAAADKNFAGLREDAAFKAARARVAPENRHFFLLYANIGQTLKQFRREVGDGALRALEALGIADIPAMAMALGYDGPDLRERYALTTTRQDRGLLKILSGGTPDDPFAASVPAGSLSYGHLGINFAEILHVLETVSKIDPDFEQGLTETLRGYEQRAGFKIGPALASLGSSWTTWSTTPEAGGLWPDSYLAASLADPAAFESALEKATKDAGFPIEELSFRGRKIKYITFRLDPLMAGIPAPVPDFFAFSFSLSYLIQDKTLLLGSTPMAIKRHLLGASRSWRTPSTRRSRRGSRRGRGIRGTTRTSAARSSSATGSSSRSSISCGTWRATRPGSPSSTSPDCRSKRRWPDSWAAR